jgi:short-subunit dehydrogenase
MPNRRYNIIEHLMFPPTWMNYKKLEKAVKQKTVLITGASFGIGERLAFRLAKTEAHLILVARTEDKLLSLKKELETVGAKVTIFSTDLAKEEEVEALISNIKALPHGLDIVVSNAGRSIMRSIQDSLDRFHDFERTMAINYFGPVRLLLGLIPLLEKNKGHIINISAINVLLAPSPYWSAYQSSKTAFDQWFRCVMPELKVYDVSCSTLYLPLVRTRMIAPTKAYDKMPAMRPDDVAKIICQFIYKRKRKFAPWWLMFGQLGSVIFRGPWEFFVPYFLKKK